MGKHTYPTLKDWIRTHMGLHGEQWCYEHFEQAALDLDKTLNSESYSSTIRAVRHELKGTTPPTTSNDVTTIKDALDFHDVDSTNLQIKEVRVGTYGSDTNPNKQVRVTLQPRKSPVLDPKALLEDFKKEASQYSPVNNSYKAREWPPLNPNGEVVQDTHLCLIALPDVHHSLLAWEEESGANYDIKISEKRFSNAVQWLLHKANKETLGKIVIALNGDTLNSEGLSNATTGGTKQSDDSRYQKAFSTCWKMIRDAVDYCKHVAEVELVINGGNHDLQISYYLGEVLSAWFANDRAVTVDNSPKYYKYKQFGRTMFGLTHGPVKLEKLPLLMATDAPEMWASTDHRYFFTGHTHAAATRGFQLESENPGCSVIVSPAMSASSDWTYRSGYRSIPEAQAYVFHPVDGRIATHHYRVPRKEKDFYKIS